MRLKTKIINQYRLPYEVSGCLALSNELCIVLGCENNKSSKFLLINAGKTEVLSYDIPLLKWDMFNYRCALYKTPDGFGSVLDNEVVEYSFKSKKFKTYPILGTPLVDEHGRETGPLGNAIKISETEILVSMEDYARMGSASFFTKLTIVSDYVVRSSFMFAMNKYQYKDEIESIATFINGYVFVNCCNAVYTYSYQGGDL